MFDGYIRDHAQWTPRAPAVVLPGRQATYAAFDADVDRFGAALAARGVGPASGVVSIAVNDGYAQYLALAALCRLGVVSTAHADEAADLRLSDHDPAPNAPAGPPRLVLSRAEIRDALAAEARRLPQLSRDHDALGRVMLSSGTTRAPRRVGMSWRRLELGNHATLHEYCAGKLGTWIPLVGINSMLGLALVMGAWSTGAAAANAIPMRDLPAALETLPPGMMSLTPQLLRTLLAHLPPDFRPQPGWRIICGGSLLPVAVARDARLRLTPDVRLIYGATEVGTIALGYAAGMADAPGQIGITPSGGIVEIIDERGQVVPEGRSGEIRVRGPRMVQGYIGDPEGTAERFKGGWFNTGDLGWRLPDGRLVLEGRLDERMNLGSAKVQPAVLEEPALECPGVRDAAAFTVPDEAGLDRCWLAIAADPGFDRDSLAPHLARYPGLPHHSVAWIDEVPRNAMGKPERDRLRDAVLAATRR